MYVVFAGLLLSVLSGCASTPNSSQPVYQDQNIRVSVEPDPSITSGSTQNNQPFNVEPAQMELLLKGVGVEREPGLLKSLVFGATREPAFTEREVAALAPPLKEALSRASPRERVSFAVKDVGSEAMTSGKVWVRGKEFHFVLDRYRAPEGRQPSRIPEPYQSSFSRGASAPQNRQPDFVVWFSPTRYVIKEEPGIAAQLLTSPETEVVIDHQRLFADMKTPGIILTDASTEARKAAVENSRSGMTRQEGASMRDGADPLTEFQVRTLSDRVKMLETQVSDLLEIVKRLTSTLEDARKSLATKENEIQSKDEQIQLLLKGSTKAPKKPK
jgi:hypothetical protein